MEPEQEDSTSRGITAQFHTLSREELWVQLDHAVNARWSQDQVLWTIFGIFWAAHAILLVALFTTGTLPSDPVVAIITSFVGILLSVTWHFLQERALGHIVRFELLIKLLENELGIEPKFALTGDRYRETYEGYFRWWPARDIMRVCSVAGTILWSLALLIFLVMGII